MGVEVVNLMWDSITYPWGHVDSKVSQQGSIHTYIHSSLYSHHPRIWLNGDIMEYVYQTPTSSQLLLFRTVTPPPPICQTWWSDPSLPRWIPPSPNKLRNDVEGLNVLPQPHCRRDHHPNPHCDLLTPPRLTCADLPPRSPRLQASPQLRRLEQHQQQLLELQQRREHQGKPKEEEARKKSEKEIKKNVEQQEEEKLRREELKQRQQIMRWQQELEDQAQQTSPQQQPQKGQATVLLSPSSGLHTIYEALESDEEGKQIEVNVQLEQCEEAPLENEVDSNSDRREVLDEDGADSNSTSTLSPSPDSPEQEESRDASPECPPPLDLDWGKKVDIVQQLINQTLLLTGDGCSSLLLLPGGTLSPLEASLWPKLLPPLTPPSATVTSVSSFSPEAPGQSPQGEWTVVELETHH
ncbi:zinc finger protein 853-like [Oncorhynchus masou masou]|uniref:zinc finger protein 853-like n=1 Tax=Oncorhynchus masou masou TaxID=90313 RepID=UPI0031835FFC